MADNQIHLENYVKPKMLSHRVMHDIICSHKPE